jgi:cell division protease FtsH
MENQDKNQPKSKNPKKPESPKKTPFGSGNYIVWYLGGLAVLALIFLLTWPIESKVADLSYGDFFRLVEQGLGAEANIETTIKKPGKDEEEPIQVRYSNLSQDIKVGRSDITGTVTRQILAPESKKTKPVPDTQFLTNRLGLENDNGQLFNLLHEKGFNVDADTSPSGWKTHIPLLFISVLFIGLFIVMMRRLGGGGGAMAFGRSRGKLIAGEEIGVTFKDVAGIDEAVDELVEVVEFLKTPEKYRMLGGRIPKGVLLVGPPGTGKTLLARAIAGEAGVPFFSMSGSDFVEMFVGVGAARVRDMFQQAQQQAPCIVFIDELDALGKTRSGSVVGGHDEREQTLNALLVEMDGFKSNSGVIVLSATNRPETLDPALMRPGRFDRHVLVDRPDILGREQILKVHINKVIIDPSIDLKKVAAITSGFCGADLANLVNEAALLAARKNKKTVTMDEFNEGVERVTTGLEKRQRVIHEDEKIRIAYHEAAHALVAYTLPNTDPVHKVSIIPRGLAALGYTMQRPEGDRYLMTQAELESRIKTLLAGTIAEELIFEDVSTGAQNDLQRATEMARSMVMDFGMSQLGRINFREGNGESMLGDTPESARMRHHSEQTSREIDEEIRRIIEQALQHVRDMLQSRRAALIAIAELLIEKEVIDTAGLDEIIKKAES